MRMIYYGKLREMLGEERQIPFEAAETVARLCRRLARLYPDAAADLLSPRARACVENVIVGEDFVVSGHDAVEFLPPLSGG